MNELSEMKEEESNLPISEKLKSVQKELIAIWQQVLPLSANKVYRLEDKTLSVLVTSELETISDEPTINQILQPDYSNPFHLNLKQHEAFVVALSTLKTLVDEMIMGFSTPWPDTYPQDWLPPQQRDDVRTIRCNLHHIQDQDWEIVHEDVPVHFENHARILGRLTKEQEQEDIIELIPEGEARARSLLEKLIKPFISSFNNVSVFAGYMQKFCDKLIPVDNTSCCIDARTRQAFDYALSEDMSTPTFSEFLNDAINCCAEDQSDSYFYILAYLMRHHWNKAYKKDTGTNGICKIDGELSSDSLDLIVEGIEQTVLELNCTKDFLYAYELVPKELQTEYLSMISEQEEYFISFDFLSDDKNVAQFSKLLKEQDTELKNFLHLFCKHLESNNFVISFTLLKNIVTAIPQEFIHKIFAMNFKIKVDTLAEGFANELQALLPQLNDAEVSMLYERISRWEIKNLTFFPSLYLKAIVEYVEKNHSPFFEFLLRTDPNLLLSNKYGQTPIMVAAATGDISGMKRLLESTLAFDINAHEPNWGLTALHYATSREYPEIVKLLLEYSNDRQKINLNALDKNFQSPLYLSAVNGNTTIVELLINSGKVDVNPGHSPLHAAVWNSNQGAAELLLEAGAEVNRGYPIRGRSHEGQTGQVRLSKVALTVLEVAVNARDFEMVKLLLKYNARPYDKVPGHPNVSLAYIAACREWIDSNGFMQDHLEEFIEMDEKIDQLLKKSEFYANPSAAVELYQLYDDYLAGINLSVLYEKSLAIEENLNRTHAKSAGLHCPATRGSRVYFVGAEELRYSTKIIREGNHAFFRHEVLSREKAYDIATTSKDITKLGKNMHGFKDRP